MAFPSEIGSQSILLHDIEEWFRGLRSICKVNLKCFIKTLGTPNMNYVFPQPFHHGVSAPPIGDGLH